MTTLYPKLPKGMNAVYELLEVIITGCHEARHLIDLGQHEFAMRCAVDIVQCLNVELSEASAKAWLELEPNAAKRTADIAPSSQPKKATNLLNTRRTA